MQMLGVFAEFRAGDDRRACDRGHGTKGRHRRLARRVPPFDYEPDPETGLLVVKEDEASQVSVIFDLYANKRLGSRAIAGGLTDAVTGPRAADLGPTPR